MGMLYSMRLSHGSYSAFNDFSLLTILRIPSWFCFYVADNKVSGCFNGEFASVINFMH